MANGIFDINQFIELNSKPSSTTIVSNTPQQQEMERQRLQAFRDAGYQDTASQDQGLPPSSGVTPQTMEERTAYNEGRVNYNADNNVNRDWDQALGDTVAGIGAGAVSSLGSLGGFAEGIFEGALNPNATIGETVSRNLSGVQNVVDAITGLQSDELQRRRQAQATRSAIQEQIDQAQYEKDLANGMGSFQAGIRDFGRDVSRYFSTQDLATLADATAQGGGSIVGTAVLPGIGSLAGKSASAFAKLI